MKKPNKKDIEKFEDKIMPEPNTGCWLWSGGLNSTGYGVIWIDGKDIKAHRYSYRINKGYVPKRLHVCHKCDVRSCVNPDHLFLGTDKDNSDDKMRKGRQTRGTGFSFSIFKDSDILFIRDMASNGIKCREISALLGCSYSNIYYIVHKKTWTHI